MDEIKIWCMFKSATSVCQSDVSFVFWTRLALSQTLITVNGPENTTSTVRTGAWTWSKCSSTPCFVSFFSTDKSWTGSIQAVTKTSSVNPKFCNYCVVWTAHTPDNTFLGFVVQPHFSAEENKQLDAIKRKKQALVYGKRAEFWQVTIVMPLSTFIFPQVCIDLDNYWKTTEVLARGGWIKKTWKINFFYSLRTNT